MMKTRKSASFRERLNDIRRRYNDEWDAMPLDIFIDSFVDLSNNDAYVLIDSEYDKENDEHFHENKKNDEQEELPQQSSQSSMIPRPPQFKRSASKKFVKQIHRVLLEEN